MDHQLCILRNLENNHIFAPFIAYASNQSESAFHSFLAELYQCHAECNVCAYLENIIVTDDNVFARDCASGTPVSRFVENAIIADLNAIYSAISKVDSRDLFDIGKFSRVLTGNAERDALLLREFYKNNGYGKYIDNRAFKLTENGVTPISYPSEITLSDLKDYEEEKRIILSNVENFLLGLPHSNMLLYGERGTGKSSTIHAIVNKYCSRKLRIIEVNKENIFSLSTLKAELASVPMRFIVFIDDLSLSGGDERISTLKAMLEGTLEGHVDNTMIVATSNRRHIIDEKFSSRNDSVHAGDSMQEELSLSDRFGISVLFASTTKPQYLSIIHQLAADYRITVKEPELDLMAERWAISKGGRSPRRAKQFISLLSAAIARGVELEF